MKTKFLLLCLISVLSFSCSSDDEESTPDTTYSIVNNTEMEDNESSELNGTLYEVSVLKYIGDDLAGQDDLEPIEPEGGSSQTIILDEDIEKIRVSFKFLPNDSPWNEMISNRRFYTQSFTFINNGENNEVEITDNTIVTNNISASSGEITTLKKAVELSK